MAPNRPLVERHLPNPAAWLTRHVQPLTGELSDWDALIDLVGDARVVMLGEASHGTAEFYAARAHITRRLIQERGFDVVAIEGDWPDAYAVNRYVQGGRGDELSALAGFERFPTWMWRNAVVLDFVGWLRRFNDQHRHKVGFYGLDVYSLHASMAAVLKYLQEQDPEAAERARAHYACLDPFREDTQLYALQAHYMDKTCEEEVVRELLELQAQRVRYTERGGAEAFFDAELNALAAANAERYYRRMVEGGHVTWNLRDRHMVNVLERILAHRGPFSRAILWEHNSHIGDFRATYEGRGGYLNVGQLVRERYGPASVAVGFGTHHGTVTAASAWDGPPEFKRVPPARAGSYEHYFHLAGVPRGYLDMTRLDPMHPQDGWLFDTHDERAIGVVYDPAREAYGNYVPSSLASRYDAYVWFDETLAVEPLDHGPEPAGLETYPEGI
jgi:erythromycin esterase-like protein